MSVINTNVQAIAAARNLNRSQEMLGRSLSRLSSGSKIVNPSDDAAGLAVSEKLDAQNLRVKAASTNVQNAISYIQTADGFMSGMTKILARMSELGLLAKDVTKNTSDVALYQEEFTALQEQLRATVGGTQADIGGHADGSDDVTTPIGTYNGIELFGPNATGHQVTIGEAVGQTMTISENDMRSNVATNDMHDIIEKDAAGAFVLKVDSAGMSQSITDAIQFVANQRASLGASQSRLELAANTLQVQNENLSAAVSRIRDVDVADETTQLARYNILVQAGTSMLAQANQSPQTLLRLLQGQ
jgi:flagellin